MFNDSESVVSYTTLLTSIVSPVRFFSSVLFIACYAAQLEMLSFSDTVKLCSVLPDETPQDKCLVEFHLVSSGLVSSGFIW